jgi:Tfp pilus assembly protein PilE
MGLLFYGLSIPPAVAYFTFRLRRTAELWRSLGLSLCLWVFLAILVSVAISDLFGAIDRSRQKLAMAQLRDLSHSYEQKRQDGRLAPTREVGPQDPWGNPIIIAATSSHYVLVSCGECGEPEQADPFAYTLGPTQRFDNDIVFSDGGWVAYPAGIQT